MTAPNVIWANWTFADEDTMPATIAAHTPKSIEKPSGTRIRYIRADAPELVALVETGQDAIRASNTLMLMLVGDLAMTKPSLEAAIKRALDARNEWDNAIKAYEALK